MMMMISMTVMMMMHHSKNRGVASNDEGERPETSNSEERKVKPAILSNQMQNWTIYMEVWLYRCARRTGSSWWRYWALRWKSFDLMAQHHQRHHHHQCHHQQQHLFQPEQSACCPSACCCTWSWRGWGAPRAWPRPELLFSLLSIVLYYMYIYWN